MAATTWVIASLSANRVGRRYLYACAFRCSQKRKSQSDKSGNLGDHMMCPGKGRSRPGNNSLNIARKLRRVWVSCGSVTLKPDFSHFMVLNKLVKVRSEEGLNHVTYAI
ncbi:hypothetical protein Trydic_g17581 [Trypoxylus dichotomus]